MKAIQVKYLGPTDNQGSRLKAWAEGLKAIVCPIDYGFDITFQAESMANIFIKKYWGESIVISGKGCLPNGDYVFTIEQAAA